jgi:hypothetical protein
LLDAINSLIGWAAGAFSTLLLGREVPLEYVLEFGEADIDSI